MDEIISQKQKIISYLSFRLGEEDFALNVGNVINILEMQAITKVPKAPKYMPGIINLRGEVLPIIDTNIKLGLGATQTTNSTCILVIETEINQSIIHFGILVDAVQEVLEIEDELILPSPSIGKKYESKLLTGVIEQNDRFIMLMRIDKLLEIEHITEIKKLTNI